VGYEVIRNKHVHLSHFNDLTFFYFTDVAGGIHIPCIVLFSRYTWRVIGQKLDIFLIPYTSVWSEPIGFSRKIIRVIKPDSLLRFLRWLHDCMNVQPFLMNHWLVTDGQTDTWLEHTPG